jgi:hypothetical protein
MIRTHDAVAEHHAAVERGEPMRTPAADRDRLAARVRVDDHILAEHRDTDGLGQ